MADSYYQDARKKARREFHACIAAGKYPYLPRLDEFLPPEKLNHGTDLGIVQIPLELVSGTRSGGRTQAFARNFLPLLPVDSEFAQKWEHLCKAQLDEGIRDPITVWEYLNRFYVEEGNKRASVLKYFGAVNIYARVKRILPEQNGAPETVLYNAFLDYWKLSRLYFPEFSKPESYGRLLRLLGQEEPWSEEFQRAFSTAYYHFKSAYESSGDRSVSTGDAMLAYLQIYGFQSLRDSEPAAIRKAIAKAREEIDLQGEDHPVDVKLDPGKEKKTGILGITRYAFKPIQAAFLHDKTPERSSWTRGHELGRQHVEQVFQGELDTTPYFDVLDQDPGAVLEQAIQEGNTLIFTTSPRLLPASLRAAVEHPEVTVFNCSLNASHRYVRTYYARMYEAKFISGAIAGSLSRGEPVGYLCDYPIYGQIAGINAFALGVEMVNPTARVYLEWSSVGGLDAALKRLTDRGIRLISSQDIKSLSCQEHEAYGLAILDGGTAVNLATPVWNWGAYYEALIRRIRDKSLKSEYSGSSKALNYYWGMSAGVVELRCSDRLPDSTRRLADLLTAAVCAGICIPFRGPLYAQGHQRMEDCAQYGMEQIIRMDWLNDNIAGTIPAYQDMDETARATVDIVGVEPAAKEKKS